MPMIAPIFLVVFLSLMPSVPPFKMLLNVAVMLIVVSYSLIFIGELLIDSPTGYALYTWLILFAGAYRSHQNPKDILATLTVMIIVMMVTLQKQFHVDSIGFPLVLIAGVSIAVAVLYLSYYLFPGVDESFSKNNDVSATPTLNIKIIVLKATSIYLLLTALIGLGSAQTMLIAITFTNLIRLPHIDGHRDFIQRRIVTTFVGILFSVPVLLSFIFGAPLLVVLGLSLFCGIQLVCYAMRRNCDTAFIQLLMTNFIMLIYQIISHNNADSLSAELLRLTSITLAIVAGTIILNLTKQGHKGA